MRSLAVAVATVAGVGYAPFAPGTVGSLAALPLLPALAALRAHSLAGYTAVLASLILMAVWAAGRAEEALGAHDHAAIVIDEVAGLAVTGFLLPATWRAAALAFVCFRVLDVVKPFPAGAIDRHGRGGVGVVGDDLVAGLYAGLLARGLLELL